jgi:hypothetical protein
VNLYNDKASSAMERVCYHYIKITPSKVKKYVIDTSFYFVIMIYRDVPCPNIFLPQWNLEALPCQ